MKIYAHRGSSIVWPENTLTAFNNAHKFGATGFETDLRLSKDKHIVLAHDASLERFGLPEKSIEDLTIDELTNQEITSPDGKYSDNVITLKALLEAYPEKDYIFDCKISELLLFQKLKRLLTDLNFHSRIWFLTWSNRADGHVKSIFPGYHFFPRANRTRIWGWFSILGLRNLSEPRNPILSLPPYFLGIPVFSKSQIAGIHMRKKIFMGYLVNTAKGLERCKACLVKTVLTDRPDLISEVLRNKGD